MNIVIFFFLIVILAVFINVQTAVFTCFVSVLFFAFWTIILKNSDKSERTIYFTAFICNFAYALACRIYMVFHNYDYLLAYDTINVFIPNLKDFLEENTNWFQVVNLIWSDYSFFNFDRFQIGYYTYLSLWGWFANSFNLDFYFTIQLANFAFASTIPVLIYKILQTWIPNAVKCYKYSIIIYLVSILFYYSSTILRDGMICVFILYIFKTCLGEFNTKGIIKIIISLFIISTLRIETGLLCSIFIPVYFFARKENASSIIYFLSIMAIIGGTLLLVSGHLGAITQLYENNYEYYTEGVSEGSGMIGFLQRLPPIIGDIFSIIFTAINPLPCWSKLFNSFDPTRPECYNIMNFPMVFSTFFNTYIIVYLTYYLFGKVKLWKVISRPLMILLIPCFIFLFLQSAVVEQRRIMAGYAVFYIIWAILHNNTSSNDNKTIFATSSITFIMLQLISAIFFIIH